MKKRSKTIIFFGSGPVASKSLESLVESFTIEAVVTKPKPKHHKGDFEVLSLAKKLGIKTIEVQNKKELDEAFKTPNFTSPVGVLVDFGIIVSKYVIDSFDLGIVNSHFSLLPQLRGADPITFAILEGLNETGVSLMLLVEAMDEGPILAQSVFPLPKDITTPDLTDKLIDISNVMLDELLPDYIDDKLRPISQSGIASYSSKLSKENGQIDPSKTAIELERQIRAFIGWPKSHITILGKDVVIESSSIISDLQDVNAIGDIFIYNKKLCIQTSKGVLSFDTLKPSGKPSMQAIDFINGYGNKLPKYIP